MNRRSRRTLGHVWLARLWMGGFSRSRYRFIALLLGLAVQTVHAANNNWINTNGGSWEIGANWSSGNPPTNTDLILITSNGTYTVNVNNATANDNPPVGGWMTVSNITIASSIGQATLLLDFTNTAQTLATLGLQPPSEMAPAPAAN